MSYLHKVRLTHETDRILWKHSTRLYGRLGWARDPAMLHCVAKDYSAWGSSGLRLASKCQLTFWAGRVAQIGRRMIYPHCAWEKIPLLRCGSSVCMTCCFKRSHIAA